MRFVSTRTGTALSFEDAVLGGWAPDGGMIFPQDIPAISKDKLQAWSQLSYPELGLEMFKMMINNDEFPHEELEEVFLRSSFSDWGCTEVVRVQEANLPLPQCGTGDKTAAIHVGELWHGPTLAFKDLGLQVLAQVLQKILQRKQQKLIVLVGTSGDTGSAAIEAVAGMPEIGIVVLYPSRGHSNISAEQEAQICKRAGEARISVVQCEGGSDDLDVPIDALFHDAAVRSEFNLGSLNSVNVVRLLMQVVHLFYCYLHVDPQARRPVVLSVPTGAAGHVAAALIGQQMGLPLGSLLACTNENDFLPRLLDTGLAMRGDVVSTCSPAMDIQVPYNIERILYLASGYSHTRVSLWMSEFYSSGKIQVEEDVLESLRSMRLSALSVGSGAVIETVRQLAEASRGYIVDPHTGVGVAGLKRHLETPPADQGNKDAGAANVDDEDPVLLCMACAHPAKFPDFVQKVFGCKSTDDARKRIPDQEHQWVKGLHQLVGGDGSTLPSAEDAGDIKAATAPPSLVKLFAKVTRVSWSQQLLDILRSIQKELEQSP